MNLKKGHYKFQFLQFFWTHMTLLVVVFQSHFIISNTLEGLIWFVLPVSLVVVNDVFAYVGGFFLGRTRLIALSPKKTWEGFIVGFLCTLIFAGFATGFMVKLPYLVCPMKDLTLSAWDSISCERNPVFIPVRYKLSPALVSFSRHFVLNFNFMVKLTYVNLVAPRTILCINRPSAVACYDHGGLCVINRSIWRIFRQWFQTRF